MFSYEWATDVMPVIQQYIDSSLLKGGIIFLIAIALVTYSSRALISVFFKRD
jgi:hypothetical protein